MNKSYYSVSTLLVMLALLQGVHGDDKHTETAKNKARTIPVFKEGEAQSLTDSKIQTTGFDMIYGWKRSSIRIRMAVSTECM